MRCRMGSLGLGQRFLVPGIVLGRLIVISMEQCALRCLLLFQAQRALLPPVQAFFVVLRSLPVGRCTRLDLDLQICERVCPRTLSQMT